MTTIKSVHIEGKWPYQYVAPERRVHSETAKEKANARKRAAYWAKKSATVKTLDGKKLLKLPVYSMTDSICERLNNESQSRF